MKLSVSSVFAAIILASSVSAAPFFSAGFLGSRATSAPGAAYFITNEPTGNFIISADMGSDGKLTLARAIRTGGQGAHGKTDPNGPDALFSQGAVKASAAGKVLAAVNAGSDTVSLFSIDPSHPSQLKQIGEPIGSGGQFPMSLAFNKAGSMLCVLNGGEINGVQCYSVDQQNGLQVMTDASRSLKLKQTTPATGPAGSASHVVFSEDGSKLIASIKGTPADPKVSGSKNVPGFLAVWDITGNGTLAQDFTKLAPPDKGLLPFSMTVIPGQNAILATDPAVGFDIIPLNGSNGTSSAVAIKGQGATCWSSFSKATGNIYLTDVMTSQVTEVNVKNANGNLQGSIIKQYPQGNGTGTIDNDVASLGTKDFMYVLLANTTTINVLSLDAPGQTTQIQSLEVAGPAKKANLQLNPNNVQGMTTFVSA